MAASRPHRYEIDMVRALTIVGVMTVHTTWFTNTSTSFWANMVMDCLHYTREVFLFMTAFVLFYNYYHRPTNWPQFWKKRFLLVGAPCVIWSEAYALYGQTYTPTLGGYLSKLGFDLVTGTAWFHLYYLLITMQIYVIMPVFVWLVKKTEGYHLWLMSAAVLVEAVMMFVFQYEPAWVNGWWGPLGAIMQYRGQVFFTYEAYLMAGALLAVHLDEVHRFLVAQQRALVRALLASLALMVAAFLFSVEVQHQPVSFGAAVLQPFMVPYALLVIAGSYLLGHNWNLRREQHPHLSALVLLISDLSFGLYLMHPMILEDYTRRYGTMLAGLPGIVATPLTLVAVAVTTIIITRLIGMTPASPWVLGRAPVPFKKRPAAARMPSAVPSDSSSAGASAWAPTQVGTSQAGSTR